MAGRWCCATVWGPAVPRRCWCCRKGRHEGRPSCRRTHSSRRRLGRVGVHVEGGCFCLQKPSHRHDLHTNAQAIQRSVIHRR
jgi:hypothetical protein